MHAMALRSAIPDARYDGDSQEDYLQRACIWLRPVLLGRAAGIVRRQRCVGRPADGASPASGRFLCEAPHDAAVRELLPEIPAGASR